MRLRKLSTSGLSQALAGSPLYLEPTGPLHWPDVFGNTQPVEVEVGCGKGLFLITAATQRPDTNFFGIELARKYALFAADRVARRCLTNVRVARADARQVLAQLVPDGSVSVLHVYFPDPWWKRRHQKRRLFTEEFVGHAGRILVPGGEFRVATDVEEYFHVMCTLVEHNPCFALRQMPPERPPEHDLDYLTNFERKYRQAGKSIFRAVFTAQRGTSGPCSLRIARPETARVVR